MTASWPPQTVRLTPGKRANKGVPRSDWADGQFISPHGLGWDAQGNLYVQDWVAQGRISRLARQD